MAGSKAKLPQDINNFPMHRAMGLPVLKDSVTLISGTRFLDVYDLSAATYNARIFTGISIANPSAATTIEVAFGEAYASTKQIVCGAQQFLTFDDMLYGPGSLDDTIGVHTTKIRAKLGTAQGSASTGTIDYSGSGNPTDGMSIVIGGVVNEFSNDGSPSNPNNVLIPIGATSDITYANFVSVINGIAQSFQISQNAGTHVLTLTSVGGGAASQITMVDGAVPTGAAFSAGTLTGFSGGVTPIFHIW